MLLRKRRKSRFSLCAAVTFLICSVGCKWTNQRASNSESLPPDQIDRIQNELSRDVDKQIDSVILALTNPVLAESGAMMVDEAGSSQPLAVQGEGVLDSASIAENLKAAWKSSGRSTCRVLKPFLTRGGALLNRPYIVFGASADVGVGVRLIAGRDFVWDLYNLQFSAFNYQAPGVVFGSGSVGASSHAYLGLAYGIRSDVDAAWKGYFVSSGVAGSLPILADYLSGNLVGFAAASATGKIDPTFVGATLGVSASLSVPSAIPGALSASVGHWTADKKMNALLAKQWRQRGIPISEHGVQTCNGSCVRFDAAGRSVRYRDRAMNLALSIPMLIMPRLAGGHFPGFEKLMLLALATGSFRDVLNAGQVCSRQ